MDLNNGVYETMNIEVRTIPTRLLLLLFLSLTGLFQIYENFTGIKLIAFSMVYTFCLTGVYVIYLIFKK